MLNDEEINGLSYFKDLIQPFDEKQLTPNGYDVSVAEIQIGDKKLTTANGNALVIPPKTNFIILTKEKVTMKSTAANLWIKTKWARQGLLLVAGVVDVGFIGQLNLCMYNSSDNYVKIKEGATIVQMVFFKVKAPQKLYAERSGHYQNQKEIKK